MLSEHAYRKVHWQTLLLSALRAVKLAAASWWPMGRRSMLPEGTAFFRSLGVHRFLPIENTRERFFS